MDESVDMLKAVNEYLENNKKLIERLKSKGIMCDIDAKEQIDQLHETIKKYMEINSPYAMLLMDLTHMRARENSEYVSLTEYARRKNPTNPSYVIQSWLRDKNTIEFLRLWEKENNPEFNNEEAEALVRRISERSFTLTTKVWIDQTKAAGIISKRGNHGGTLAHRDIAIDFIVWLFPEKRYELVKMIGSRIFDSSTGIQIDEHADTVGYDKFSEKA